MKPNYTCPYCGNENNLILLPNDLHPNMKEGDKAVIECEWCYKKAFAYYENGKWVGYGVRVNPLIAYVYPYSYQEPLGIPVIIYE